MASNVLPLATVAAPVAGPLAAAAVAALPVILRVSGVRSGDPGDHGLLARALGWLPGLALIGAAVACARFPDDSSFVIGSTAVTIGPIARVASVVACTLAALVALLGAASQHGSGTAIAAAAAGAAIVVMALSGAFIGIAAAGIHVAMLVAVIAMATSGTGSPERGQGGWRGASATLTLGSLGLVIILAGLSLADVLRVSPGGLVTESFVIAVLAVGFALAIGLPPLHFWIPVVAWRGGRGSSMIALGIVVPAAVGYLVQVLGALPQLGGAALTARVLTAGGLVACVVGATGALAGGRLGRRVGYASIAGIGPVLLGLGTGTRIGVAGALVALAHHAVCTIILVATAPRVEATSGESWSDARRLLRLPPTLAQATGAALARASGGRVDDVPDADDDALPLRERKLPRQARLHRVAFVLAAVAASGIPPLGGFASRWAIMQALSLSDWRLGMAAGITALVTLGALLSGARQGGAVRVMPAPPLHTPDDGGGRRLAAQSQADGSAYLIVVYAMGACAWGVAPAWAIEHAWQATAQLGYLRPF
jgi:formate hydrogenlyase subunit 3/multisubunit Na+/H+ antiporter MnhD subunit